MEQNPFSTEVTPKKIEEVDMIKGENIVGNADDCDWGIELEVSEKIELPENLYIFVKRHG